MIRHAARPTPSVHVIIHFRLVAQIKKLLHVCCYGCRRFCHLVHYSGIFQMYCISLCIRVRNDPKAACILQS